MTVNRGIGCLFSLALLVAAASTSQAQLPTTLQIPLFPEFDQFGNQFEVVQTWDDGTGPRTAFSIYDTGASVVTLSSADQSFFDFLEGGVPIKTPGGASATAIGGSGTLTGDVSMPGDVRAAGISAFDLETFGVDLTAGIVAPGIQMFVGTEAGSSVLPTITGTPIHIPKSTPGHEDGTAALIDMRSYQLDLEAAFDDPLYNGIFLPLPDVSFIPRGHTLTGKADTFEPIYIPVSLFGEDNTANEGELPSASYNPLVQHVRTTNEANIDIDRTFLFDTGAQLTIISTDTAIQLGLNLAFPETEIDVQGASGTATIPGFTIDSLQIPRDVPGTYLEFTNVPVYVLDIGEGIEGILGMNLFNGADELLYDPFRSAEDGGPLFSVTFLADRSEQFEEELLDAFNTANPIITQETQAILDPYLEYYALLFELQGHTPEQIEAELAVVEASFEPLTSGLGLRYAVTNPAVPGIDPSTLLGDLTQDFPIVSFTAAGDINILADSTYTLTGITPPVAGTSLITAVQAGLGFELNGEFATLNVPGSFLDLPNDQLARRLSVLYEGRAADGSGLVDTMKIGIAQPGDLDFDGDVDFDDAFALVNNYGIISGATWRDGDLNGNGTVDFDDAFDQINFYGSTYAGAGLRSDLNLTAAPEPSSLALGLIGVVGLASCRRRRRG